MLKKEDFFFNEEEKKIFFLVLKIGAVVVSGMILLAVLLIIFIPPDRTEISPDIEPETAVTEKKDQTGSSKHEPILSENRKSVIKQMELYSFVIPEAEQESLEPAFYRFRTPLARWNDSLVMRFWIDPVEIGIENITEENDKNIKELFDGIQ